MEDKYSCSKCGTKGAKQLVPYKIIYDVDGQSVKFVKQLCEKCFKEIFETNEAPAPSTEEKDDK